MSVNSRGVRRFAFAVARWAGVYVVTPETLLEWAERAEEHTRIAGDYDDGDQRLCGLNDGRAESLNRCVAHVVRENAPNGQALAQPGRKETP